MGCEESELRAVVSELLLLLLEGEVLGGEYSTKKYLLNIYIYIFMEKSCHYRYIKGKLKLSMLIELPLKEHLPIL